MLRWGDGPKKLGCVYHKRGIRAMKGEHLVVDVFIMPRLLRKRPIAITVGRYRDYKSIAKKDWQMRTPIEAVGSSDGLSRLFEGIGVPKVTALALAAEVGEFLTLESEALRSVLALLSLPAA